MKKLLFLFCFSLIGTASFASNSSEETSTEVITENIQDVASESLNAEALMWGCHMITYCGNDAVTCSADDAAFYYDLFCNTEDEPED